MSDVEELVAGSVGFELFFESGGVEAMSTDVFAVHVQDGL